MPRTRRWRLAAAGCLLAVAGAACAGTNPQSEGGTVTGGQAGTAKPQASQTPAASSTQSKGAELVANMNALFGENIMLLGAYASAGLDKRPDEGAAATALNGPAGSNTADLGAYIGTIYGPSGKQTFEPAWRTLVGYFADYVQASAAKDNARKKQAVDQLSAYATQFGKTIEQFNGYSAGEVKNQMVKHINAVKDVIDRFHGGDVNGGYSSLREAGGQIAEFANGFSKATTDKLVGKYSRDTDSRGAQFRARLTRLMREQVYLAGASADATVAGRSGEATAAANALNATGSSNSSDIIGMIGTAYGSQLRRQFEPLWRQRVQLAGDYAKGDAAGKRKQTEALNGWATQLGQFFNSAAGMSAADVTKLANEQNGQLLAAIDAYAAKDFAKAYAGLRSAAQRSDALAAAIADATAKKFPSDFS